MKRNVYLIIILFGLLAAQLLMFGAGAPSPTPGSSDEQTVWNLERDYWRYVEQNNLSAYFSLWHRDFLGWPGVSAKPLQKDHILDG